jgi:ABC-type branched-subunit amino acid transport system substrate-binding protein
MKELDINAPVYSGDVMETPDVIQSGYADGVKYAVGKISNPEDFAEKVKRETGKTSEFATPLGYDSLYIFAEIIEKVGTDPEAIKNELYKYKKTDGISFPVIEFDNEGDLKEAIYDVKVIEDGEARVIN